MAQHDYNIANQSGADFRADLNNALSAIVTVNSGATEPSTTFAHQLWVDTANSVLKIRNAADNAWYTTGISITASNTLTGDLTGNVVGNVTGNLVGNVTGDLTGNADSADTLSTARTISLSGDVVGSASFDGSANIDIDTVVQINSITLGTDTTGDYVESMSGGTGVTVTGGTGEGSTPSIAIGQSVATTDNVTFNLVTATNEFVGDICGAVRFSARASEALSKGDIVYVSGVSGDVALVRKAKADDTSKMPAFGLAVADANENAEVQVATFGTLEGLDTSGVSEGQTLYVSTTAGAYTTTAPTGESSQIQNIGKVIRSHASAGSIKVGGAGRSNATPNLDDGKIFIGNGSNQSSTATLDTSIVVENTNLYYTTTRANTDFDTRLATKDTGDLTEGTNLYYTTARVNSDFDTRLATKSTSDLAEGTNLYYTSARFDSAFTSKDTDDLSEGTTNLYYTTARFDSAFGNKTTADLTENTNLYYTDTRANSAIDARVTKAFVDALGIQASSVDANSVTLGTDTVGNYIQTITGTANKITVTGSGSESADVTLTLPDDVQIADSLTVAGNLTVNGTLTSLDTTNLDIEDNLFQLNAGLTGSPVNDSGMLINRGTADNGIFMWDESVDKFTLGLTTADGSATGNITLNSLGTLVANIEGAVTGNVTGTVSSLSNHDTDDLAEGSNLYYTQARFDSAFTAKSTSDLSEGTNLYYTDARFDTRLATKDTGDLTEGSNLYYTDARAQAVSINNVVEDTTPQLGGNLDLNSSDITGTGNINITGTIQSSGNITGTLATAAQPNITSVGTLTGFTSTGIDDNATSTAITIDSSENVGIGGSPTNYSDHKTLSLYGNTGTGAGFIEFNDTSGNADAVIFSDDGNLFINADYDNTAASSSIRFRVDGSSEKMRIGSTGGIAFGGTDTGSYGKFTFYQSSDTNGGGISVIDSGLAKTGRFWTDGTNVYLSSGATGTTNLVLNEGGGNVGIGTSPSNALDVQTSAGKFSVEALGGGSVRLASNGSMGMNVAAGFSYEIDVGGSEVMRIDSSGNLLVSKTSSDTLGTAGHELHNSGMAHHTRATGTVLYLNRTGDDGNIINLRKDNSTVGSIGVANGDLNIDGGASHSGIRFQAGSLLPRLNGSDTNGTIDLGYDDGSAIHRFKDLYLSGTGYFGTSIGIGTSSPAAPLHVATSSGDSVILVDNGTSQARFATDNDGPYIYALTSGDSALRVFGESTERLRIDSAGNVLQGTTTQAGNAALTVKSSAGSNTGIMIIEGDTNDGWGLYSVTSDDSFRITQYTHSGTYSDKLIIDSSGNLLVGKTSTAASTDGIALLGTNGMNVSRGNANVVTINRNTSDGSIITFQKDGTTVGSIGSINSSVYIHSPYGSDAGLRFAASIINPCTDTGADRDDAIDLGKSSARFDDIYATNGTIQTSDRNEKQDIEDLTETETRVAVAAKGLLKKFKFKSAVEEKGDEARIHFGIIAQDLQDAFTAEGLDASDYAMFCSNTWTDEDGVEQTRLGVRYSELLAFIIAAI